MNTKKELKRLKRRLKKDYLIFLECGNISISDRGATALWFNELQALRIEEPGDPFYKRNYRLLLEQLKADSRF